jgi:iron complex transport system permease protein
MRLNLILLSLLSVAAVISLLIGRGGSLALWSLFNSDPHSASVILWQLRLPRLLLGIMVGASLGLSGAVLQGLLRNPLAEPSLLGVSSGAALGAVIVFYFSLGGALALPLGGMLGALTALGLIYLLAGRRPDALTIILAGVAINAFSSALTSLALNLAPNPYAALEIVFWLLGSLADRGLDQFWLALPPTLLGWLLLASCARALDALTLGEDTAHSLGFRPGWVQLRAISGSALVVGAAVAVTGIIGFVGLVVPHLLRPWVQHRPGRLLLPSALGGAALLTAADCLARWLAPGQELHLGVVTALLGAPFFLYLLMQYRNRSF